MMEKQKKLRLGLSYLLRNAVDGYHNLILLPVDHSRECIPFSMKYLHPFVRVPRRADSGTVIILIQRSYILRNCTKRLHFLK